MLVGAYPFEDPTDPRNFRKTIQRIMGVKYSFPANLQLSRECHDLMAKIFVANPSQRIAIEHIKKHPWFLRNLPPELRDDGAAAANAVPAPPQSVEEIKKLVEEARTKTQISGHNTGRSFNEEEYMDSDLLEDEELVD